MRPPEQPHTAAAGEGRERVRGKTVEPTGDRPQRRSARQQARDRLRVAARQERARRVTAVWPHVDDLDRRREAYDGVYREASPDVEGQTWATDGAPL
jgi:hypothetical protein